MQTTKPPSKRTESEIAIATCPVGTEPYEVAEGVMLLPDGRFVVEGMKIDLKRGTYE